MRSILLLVLLAVVHVFAVDTNYNRIPLTINRCIAPTHDDKICYDSVPNVTAATLKNVPYVTLFHYEPPENICLDPLNITCTDLFCSTREYLLSKLTNRTSLTQLLSLHTMCYFCNSEEREEFQERLAANSCPYFWKHDPNYCYDTERDDGESLMSYSILGQQVHTYYNRRKSLDPSLNIDPTTVDGFINLTLIRHDNNDHFGERERGELGYICLCQSTHRWGLQCDTFTHVLLPFYTEVLPFLYISFKFAFSLLFFTFVTVPKHVVSYRRQREVGATRFKAVLAGMVAHLDIVASMTTFLSMLFSSVMEIAGLFDGPATFTLNGIAYMLFGVTAILLIVHWSHIYDCSSELLLSGSLSRKNKILLGALLSVLGMTLVLMIVGIIVGSSIDAVTNIRAQALGTFFSYYNASLLFMASAFITAFAIGFLVNGLRMYCILKKVNSNISILQLRVTRMMILVDLAFLHFIVWLCVHAYWLIDRAGLGGFMSLFNALFVNVAMFMTFGAITLVLFSPSDLKSTFSFLKCKQKKKEAQSELTTRYYRLDDVTT